jgi:hypothetical protein
MLRQIDFSAPETLKLLEQAIDKRIKDTYKLKEAADYSLLPRELRSDAGIDKFNMLAQQLKTLEVARDELAMLKKDAASYNDTRAARSGAKNDSRTAPGSDVVADGKIKMKIDLNAAFTRWAASPPASADKAAENAPPSGKPEKVPAAKI